MELRFRQQVGSKDKDDAGLKAGSVRIPPPWVIKKIEDMEKKKKQLPLVDQPTVSIDEEEPPGYTPSEREPPGQVERGVAILQL